MEKKNVFDNFCFNKTASTPSFDFLNKPEQAKTNGINNEPAFKTPNQTAMFKAPENTFSLDSCKDEYYSKLKGLNESVSQWIKEHVDANPFINLAPIFKDYTEYFTGLEKYKVESSQKKEHVFSFQLTRTKTSEDLESFVFKSPVQSTTKETYTFKETTKINNNQGNSPKIAETSLAIPATPEISTSKSTFSFGTPNTTATGFSFAGANTTPFTFKNVASNDESNKNNDEETNENNEEEEEPIKVAEEEGHIYKIRCKVFVKKEGAFADGGVGNLFLKPIPDSEKVQLIVRADTSLGNVLCNFILSENVPIQKMGKKDVMLVCLPTPDHKPPPVPILLRVKTPEEADNLFKELEKHKK